MLVLVYIDPPFNSNRNYGVFWGETKEKRAFEDRHASTAAYLDFMRPRCVELARVLKPTGSLYYHCDWHASHYAKVMLDQIFGENQRSRRQNSETNSNCGASMAVETPDFCNSSKLTTAPNVLNTRRNPSKSSPQ